MKHSINFKEDIILNQNNYSSINPINKNNVKRKKMNGKYVYERFYLIDFYGIKKNAYVISSFGRMFSLLTNKEMKLNRNKRIYDSVTLQSESGKRRTFLVHCLVARAFIPKKPNDKKLNRVFVHHKNWDNDYNYCWNLEWLSGLELYAKKNVTKLEPTEDKFIEIVCKLLQVQTPIVDIFEIMDRKISKDKISKIKNRSIYQTISKDYVF